MASRKPRKRAPPAPRRRPSPDPPGVWLYGLHAVRAALANPRRALVRLLATPVARSELEAPPGSRARRERDPEIEIAARDAIARHLPPGAVHQGVALLAAPLAPAPLAEIVAAVADDGIILALDRVNDPRNVGAILRAAAAFRAAAVIMPARGAPPESGALAKAASGALESVALVRVTNLAQALVRLGEAGFFRLGLDAGGPRTLAEAAPEGPVALVLGGEGAGLRRLTRERCDTLARLPIAAGIDSLNVASAAAIALYELRRTAAR